MYDLLQDLVRKPKYAEIQDKAIINITGCPNSCSPFRIADIGLRGMRMREELGSVEGYQIRVGGDHNRFGDIVGEYKTNDCLKVIEQLLDTYLEKREGDETLSQCVQRIGKQ
jgi:sulfite reductase beta subunit-like hemoprotein